MNKTFITIAALLSVAVMAFAGGKKDPVIMTVAGEPVKLSEFQYLYNKNNTQQQQPISFDEYVQMFVDYKLKVADARANGVDTTASFMREFTKFRNELAEPYLADSSTQNQLVMDVYGRMGEEVLVSHIMLPPNKTPNDANDQRIDSIRTAILNGEITFEEAAAKYSVDKRSGMRGGRMGWIKGNSGIPYKFEEMAYATAVGEVSPVVDSGFGYHIIKVENRRPNRGEVKAEHILVLTHSVQGDEALAACKAKIDSIYEVVSKPGVDFADVAKRESQDPGSARNGGDLGWFGSGKMVAEFDSVAFALNVGEISKPFATAYGYHIVHKTDARGSELPSVEELKEEILNKMKADERGQMPIKATIRKMEAKNNVSFTSDLENLVKDYALKGKLQSQTYDSIMAESMKSCPVVAYTIGKNRKITVGEVIQVHPLSTEMPIEAMPAAAVRQARAALDEEMLEAAREDLLLSNADYRNLVKEYRDGIMLFDISNEKVWNKASKDTTGLSKYFAEHRSSYSWEKPKYKSYVIFANNDSVLTLAKEFVKDLDASKLTHKSLTADLRSRFGKEIRIERVLASKGENAITDYLGFGAERPKENQGRWSCYFAFDGRQIMAPEDLSDVRGAVISDYQAQLEKEWIDYLRSNYKVKINEKALKNAR